MALVIHSKRMGVLGRRMAVVQNRRSEKKDLQDIDLRNMKKGYRVRKEGRRNQRL